MDKYIGTFSPCGKKEWLQTNTDKKPNMIEVTAILSWSLTRYFLVMYWKNLYNQTELNLADFNLFIFLFLSKSFQLIALRKMCNTIIV